MTAAAHPMQDDAAARFQFALRYLGVTVNVP